MKKLCNNLGTMPRMMQEGFALPIKHSIGLSTCTFRCKFQGFIKAGYVPLPSSCVFYLL